jgi:hypothetical protein
MPGRLGPRFAIEALFLIALAVAAAYADLASKWIVIVMAVGWLVVALLELSADRIWAAAPPWRRPYYVPVSPPRAETAAAQPPHVAVEPPPEVQLDREPQLDAAPEPEVQLDREPELDAAPTPQAEAVTVIAQRVEPTATPPEPEEEPDSELRPEPELEPVAAERVPPKLEPLQSKPKRRWFRRREREAVAVEVPEIEMPKHVRLLPADERTARSNEVTDLFDVPEHEDRTLT